MRITEKSKYNIDGFSKYVTKHDIDLKELMDKLGEYEDIEELCQRVRKDGVYIIDKVNEEIFKMEYTLYDVVYNFQIKCIEIYNIFGGIYHFHALAIDEYGKTWAFTKEELK